MAADSPKPKRGRRWWWIGIVLLMAIATAVGFAFRERRRAKEWSEACYARGLVMDAEYVCIIPGVDQETLNWYLGRPIVRVVIQTDKDARALLDLPRCPLPMQIFMRKGLSPETPRLLRQQFGDAVQ